MDGGWRRLGRRIQAERARKGYPTARALADAAGLSDRTIENIETGNHPGRPRNTTLSKIEQALGWQEGSCERIVHGGRPREVTDPLLAKVTAAWPRLTDDQKVALSRLAERLVRER